MSVDRLVSLPEVTAESVREPYPPLYTRYVLFMVLLTMIFSNVDRTILSILIKPIKAEFELTDTEMGWLLGPAFAIIYTALCLPLGRYADTTGVRRNIVSGSLFLWSLFTCSTAFVTNYFQLFLMRMGVGVGEAGGTSPSVSMLSDYLSPARRASGISVVSIGAVLGMGIGMVLGGWISERWGWRTAFLSAGLPGVLLSILYRLTIREPKRGGSEGRQAGSIAFWPTFRALLRTRTYQFILAANGFALFASMGRNLWEPEFLIRTYRMGQFEAGTWYFLTSPLPSMLGIYLGGFFADRLGARDTRWYMWVPAVGNLVSVPVLVAFLLWPEAHRIATPGFLAAVGLSSMPIALVWSVFGSVIGGTFTAPFMSTIQGVAPLRMRAFAAAVSTLVTTLVGLAAGPLLVGVIADGFAERFGEDALRYSLLVPTLTPLLSAAICLLGAGHVGRDLERARSLDR
ncbi:MAG: MFS transporter [Myxococcota bacterium]